jgi:hypothetical protein
VASTPSCLPLEELASYSLKHKIDYTQSHTQSRSKLKHGCISEDAYRKVGGTCRTRNEGYLVWFLGYSWREHGNSRNTPSWHVGQPLLYCLSFETWPLPKGRHRVEEGDRMDGYFCMPPNPEVGGKTWRQNNPGSNR